MKLEKYTVDYRPTGAHDQFGEPIEDAVFVKAGDVEIKKEDIEDIAPSCSDDNYCLIKVKSDFHYVKWTDDLRAIIQGKK